jgi:DNA-directed RNA polymerase subunit RPC12/RpoP
MAPRLPSRLLKRAAKNAATSRRLIAFQRTRRDSRPTVEDLLDGEYPHRVRQGIMKPDLSVYQCAACTGPVNESAQIIETPARGQFLVCKDCRARIQTRTHELQTALDVASA